jgi:hypothetical protein
MVARRPHPARRRRPATTPTVVLLLLPCEFPVFMAPILRFLFFQFLLLKF